MSRVGKQIIPIPAGVSVNVTGNLVSVSGPNGTLTQEVKSPITVNAQDGNVNVTRGDDSNQSRALHGLYNRLIQNMIKGVTKGFTKYLVLNGVGYKAVLKGENLSLNLGMSHASEVKAESGIKFKVLTPQDVQAMQSSGQLGKDAVTVVIAVTGVSREKVGAMASRIKDLRPVEPYHLYGIRYHDEWVMRKESKSGAKGGKK